VKSALVTGASRGIGRGIATSLARQGYGLTIVARHEAALTELASELRRIGAADVAIVSADMADADAAARIVHAHRARFDALSALILNAGVGTAGPIETAPRQSVEKTIQVNFTSALTLIQQSLPMLRTAADRDTERGAKVIALASITGVYPEPGLAVYGATKAALISLIATLNAEESAAGVTATAIAPGYVDTDMSAWVSDTVAPSSMIRVADVVEVVNMVLRLGRTASIAQIVMSRSGSPGYLA
jgi:short-subunit dehydrogenase